MQKDRGKIIKLHHKKTWLPGKRSYVPYFLNDNRPVIHYLTAKTKSIMNSVEHRYTRKAVCPMPKIRTKFLFAHRPAYIYREACTMHTFDKKPGVSYVYIITTYI